MKLLNHQVGIIFLDLREIPGGVGFFPSYRTDYADDIDGDVFLFPFIDSDMKRLAMRQISIAAHEIGHALGLKHPFHAGTQNPAFHVSV